MEELRTRIRKFVVDNFLFGKEAGLTETTSFLDQGIVDSTGVMELVAHLEKEFGVKIDDHELVPENLDSVVLAAEFVSRKLAAK